jgi:hypothetical protein
MGIFDSDWDALIGKVDAIVDDRVGDRISYSIGGAPATMLPGFVITVNAPRNLEDFDEILGTAKRVKIAKRLVPKPNLEVRVEHPKLGAGKFRPIGDEPDEDDRYWLFDVQKAST